MLAFVPKTAHPAALVQLLPERAAFGRLKRLGHSGRWEMLLANPRCGVNYCLESKDVILIIIELY